MLPYLLPLAAALSLALAATASAQGIQTSRYWDACKPGCAWTTDNPHGTAAACDVNGAKLSDADAVNSCSPAGGPAYTCMGQAPWSVSDDLSYGFATFNMGSTCGKCFELSFTNTDVSGKKMVVMVSTVSNTTDGPRFDLMIPGGGTGGLFDAFSSQIDQNGGDASDLGSRFGGFRATCGDDAPCVRRMCDAAFGAEALADLKAGCYWYVDWFLIANNPNANYTEVECPAELVTAYKEGKRGSSAPPIPPISTAARYGVSANKANASARVALSPTPRGFTAAMPANHGYTSYSLVDLRGREVRSGKIPVGATNLRFDGLNRSVMFLRLSGNDGRKGGMTVLRAVPY